MACEYKFDWDAIFDILDAHIPESKNSPNVSVYELNYHDLVVDCMVDDWNFDGNDNGVKMWLEDGAVVIEINGEIKGRIPYKEPDSNESPN